MNAPDVMKYGHLTVMGTIEGLPEARWNDAGVCGVWSTREIIAHLACYELVLADVLQGFAGGGSSPLLERYLAQHGDFNDAEVGRRQGQSVTETLAEYTSAYEQVARLAPGIPPETWSRAGTIPWYGDEYSLDDWIVYQFYGHKREHCAEIAVFRDKLARESSVRTHDNAG
jgi:hypothetical protein